MLFGYKGFDKGMRGMNDFQFEVGKSYAIEGDVVAGPIDGNGFHMCEKLEDVFRFFDGLSGKDFDVCLVRGSGNFSVYEDTYNDYTFYAFEKMDIIKTLTREEIVQYGLDLHDNRLYRFIATCQMTPPEVELFERKFKSDEIAIDELAYYQRGQKDVYVKKRGKKYE